MNLSPHPLRTVVRWTQSGADWIVLYSCGHRADFGRGKVPTFEAYPCVGCAKDERAVESAASPATEAV